MYTNIVESVQIFEHLDKLSSKSSLYEANEFQFFQLFFELFIFYQCLYVNVVTRTGLHIPGVVGQRTCRVEALVLCFCS